MADGEAHELLGLKRPRPSVTAGITPPTYGSVPACAAVGPRAPLPCVRKSAVPSPSTPASAGNSRTTTPLTPSVAPPIAGVLGGRVAKWGSMIGAALMRGRSADAKERVGPISARIASAIPGDREAAADGFRVLLVALQDEKNEQLREDVVEGRLPVEVLVCMTERDLRNPEARRQQEEAFLERSRNTDLTEIRKALATKSTLFQCPSCKAKDCTWTQKQARSGDEPMTVFCLCNICDYKWRKN